MQTSHQVKVNDPEGPDAEVVDGEEEDVAPDVPQYVKTQEEKDRILADAQKVSTCVMHWPQKKHSGRGRFERLCDSVVMYPGNGAGRGSRGDSQAGYETGKLYGPMLREMHATRPASRLSP